MTAIYVRNNVKSITSAPTLDTSIYASGDTLATTLMTFSGGSGQSGIIEKLLVIDKDVQSQPGELWLFSQAVTPAATNLAHSISDADALLCIGVVSFGAYFPSALNSISVAKGVGLTYFTPNGLLFGIAVTRGTPTHTASGLLFALQLTLD